MLFFERPAKMAFLTVNNFFCAFSKTPTKRTFERLFFLKLNQSRNTRKKNVWGVFFKNPKRTICSLMQKKASCQFSKKNIYIWAPGIFWKWKLWRMHAENLDLDFKNPTWPLVSWPILADQKKFPHSTLMYTVICIKCLLLPLFLLFPSSSFFLFLSSFFTLSSLLVLYFSFLLPYSLPYLFYPLFPLFLLSLFHTYSFLFLPLSLLSLSFSFSFRLLPISILQYTLSPFSF